MAINRELSQFGRLVQIIDNVSIGIGTTSNISIGFGTITATTINATTINGSVSSTDYALTAGIATYASTAGIATYASTAGISTVATNAQGLTGTPNISVGIVTATSFVKSGGTSSQFLKADGTVDTSTYLTTTGSAANLINITGASANTYGNSTTVPQLTVDSNGRITSISNVTISASAPSSSSQWTTGATGITTTSNVGIGTTLPTANLHVVGSGTTVIIIDGGNAKIIGNLNVTGTVFATDFDAVPGGGSYQGVPGIVTSIVAGDNITVSGSTGQVTINSTASGSSQWITGASGITTTSNVGIKSTVPTSALDVTGDVKISGVATATSFIKSGGTSSQFLKADGSVDSTTYASQSYVDSKVGLSTTGLLASTGSGVNLTGIVTSIVAGTNVTVSGSTGQVTINSTASGSQWTTGASGISTTSNVGIKNATPTSALDVTGDVKISGVTTSSGGIVVGSTFIKNNAVGLGTTTTTGRNAGVGTAVGTIIYNASVSTVQLYTVAANGSNAWLDFSPPLGSILNPALNAKQILNQNPSATDGIYWFKDPNGSNVAYQTYCIMQRYGGGWMKALQYNSNTALNSSFAINPNGNWINSEVNTSQAGKLHSSDMANIDGKAMLWRVTGGSDNLFNNGSGTAKLETTDSAGLPAFGTDQDPTSTYSLALDTTSDGSWDYEISYTNDTRGRCGHVASFWIGDHNYNATVVGTAPPYTSYAQCWTIGTSAVYTNLHWMSGLASQSSGSIPWGDVSSTSFAVFMRPD